MSVSARLHAWLDAAPAVELERLPTPSGAWRPELRLLVVGCGAAKRSTAAAAEELYTGPLTRDAIGYARASGLPWCIVSGRHGLLWPSLVVEPYEQRIPRGEALRGWTDRVGSQLSLWMDEIGWRPRIRRDGDRYGTLPGSVILEVHAGSDYVRGLVDRWWSVETPLAGLSMLQRRRWYREARDAGSQQVSLFGGDQ
jgi:hypothetical protein